VLRVCRVSTGRSAVPAIFPSVTIRTAANRTAPHGDGLTAQGPLSAPDISPAFWGVGGSGTKADGVQTRHAGKESVQTTRNSVIHRAPAGHAAHLFLPLGTRSGMGLPAMTESTATVYPGTLRVLIMRWAAPSLPTRWLGRLIKFHA